MKLLGSSLAAGFLSVIPVTCRSPLFINSMLAVFGKLNTGGFTSKRSLFSLSVVVYSLFTVGGYSDIAYNGMHDSDLYKNNEFFRTVIYPIILGVVVLAMDTLNADGIVATADRYFAKPKKEDVSVLLLTDPKLNEQLMERVKAPPAASPATLLAMPGTTWAPPKPTDPLLPLGQLPHSYSLNTEPPEKPKGGGGGWRCTIS